MKMLARVNPDWKIRNLNVRGVDVTVGGVDVTVRGVDVTVFPSMKDEAFWYCVNVLSSCELGRLSSDWRILCS